MRSRSAAANPSSTTAPQTVSSSSCSIEAANARCSSSKAGMRALLAHEALRLRRFVEQHRERRHVGVPFDERRHAAENGERLGIERPPLARDARAVVVDADRASVLELAHLVTREVDLADALRRQGVQIAPRIEAVVAGTHEDVVDVAQDAASGAPGERRDEFPFGARRMAGAQGLRGVLDKDAAPEKILRSLDVAADDR